MRTEPTIFGRRLIATCLLLLCIGGLTAALPQQSDDEATRDIWNKLFRRSRTTVKKSPPPKQAKENKEAAARDRTNQIERAPLMEAAAEKMETAIGITFWRLRIADAREDDKAARILSYNKKKKGEPKYVAERIDNQTQLAAGDMIRIGVEVPRLGTGYLYVIDRERFADGSFSEPYLIFPIKQLRDGDNRVIGGRLVEIPHQEADPPYFELEPKANQVAEILTILVTPEPLDLPIGLDARLLTREELVKLQQWEEKWAVKTEQIRLNDGSKTFYTKSEQAAGSNPDKLLKESDPLPGMVYNLAARPGDPLVINVRLQYGK